MSTVLNNYICTCIILKVGLMDTASNLYVKRLTVVTNPRRLTPMQFITSTELLNVFQLIVSVLGLATFLTKQACECSI